MTEQEKAQIQNIEEKIKLSKQGLEQLKKNIEEALKQEGMLKDTIKQIDDFLVSMKDMPDSLMKQNILQQKTKGEKMLFDVVAKRKEMEKNYDSFVKELQELETWLDNFKKEANL